MIGAPYHPLAEFVPVGFLGNIRFVFAEHADLFWVFEVGEVLAFGIGGALLVALDFPVAPILLGYVLGPMVEENFRRSMLLARGSLASLFESPISATVLGACLLLVAVQLFFRVRGSAGKPFSDTTRLASAQEPQP